MSGRSRDHFNRLSDKLLIRIFRLAFLSQFIDSEPYADGKSFPLSEVKAQGCAPRRDLRSFAFPLHSSADIPRNITLVCRAWRTLTLQMHDLWAALVLGPTTDDYGQEVLDEWLYRRGDELMHLFVQFGDPTKRSRSGDPSLVFQFRHNAERLHSITFDLHTDKENVEAIQKAFSDLDRLKPPSLRRIFLQYVDRLALEHREKSRDRRLDAQREREGHHLEEDPYPLNLPVPVTVVKDAFDSFPNHVWRTLEEYGATFPARYKECLPWPEGPTRLRVLHLLVPLTCKEIITWINLSPLLLDGRFCLSSKEYKSSDEVVDEEMEELPIANAPNLRSIRISCEIFRRIGQDGMPSTESLNQLLDKLDISTNFREAHFETKSHRSQMLSVILAFLETCFTQKQIVIETLSLHGGPFKIQYPETALSEGAYIALRQLRRLNVHERFLGQNGIVSLMVQRSRMEGGLALPLLKELHVHEYEPSSSEDIAAFVCSHSYTRTLAVDEPVDISHDGDVEGSHNFGSLRRVVFSYNGTKQSSASRIIANLPNLQAVADCVRDGLEVSVRLGSQLAQSS